MLKITPINVEKQTGGTWTSYMGVQLKIARSNNENFVKKFRTLIKPVKRDFDKGMLAESQMEEILCDSLAGTVLVDWEFEDIEFNVKNAIELLTNDPDCRAYVQEFSEDISNYLDLEKEELKGKS